MSNAVLISFAVHENFNQIVIRVMKLYLNFSYNLLEIQYNLYKFKHYILFSFSLSDAASFGMQYFINF